MKNSLCFLMILIGSASLTGCQTFNRQDAGMVGGGVAGGFIGNTITGGSTLGTIGGAVGGAYLGRTIVKDSR